MPIRSGNTRRTAPSANRKPAGRVPAKKAAPVSAVQSRDVTQYADKPATAYHKAYAKWIATEVLSAAGVDLNSLSPRAAFLKGVSIAIAARPVYNASDAYEEFRENSGEAKRGRKPASEEAAPARRGPGRPAKAKPAPEPEPEEDEEEWEDDAEEAEEDFDDDDSDDTEDDEDFEDDEEEDDEPEPAPVKRGPGRPRKAAAPAGKSSSATGGARRQAPAKATGGRKPAGQPAKTTKAAQVEDDDFLF